MSPRSRRRPSKNSARRARAQRGAAGIPRPRTSPEETFLEQPEPFVSNDDALLVLHRAVEDPAFQQFVDRLPLVHLVDEFLEWIGDGVEINELAERTATEEEEEDDTDDSAEVLDVDALPSRLGVATIGATGVERWRSQVIALACSRWGVISHNEDGLERSPDGMGWTAHDPVERTWVRTLVVASAMECTVRYVSAQHIAGGHVRQRLATMIVSAGEDQPLPLGLVSALHPNDLLAEHVDRIVREHVEEMRVWGVLADGADVCAAPGAEPFVRSLAINLQMSPVLEPAA
ncbi:hypothetical protein SAMN06264364_13740 [Quadrisphaera granulorum]|uniref:Uncharacterized protein n=1 Tax=Quadrisphaera granulorum TaxID=317664 RepID=A0A316ACI9_9ACTN|nr:hypothetical protein [Quadrisphaera granulorum]PWJ47497.1 hypothetical protein BXY45_13740 [Quadrisphaera granulorum]SZE98798.1 hypothetical protein SAMN06264364_13740 [Quadrisphaera granulorum]